MGRLAVAAAAWMILCWAGVSWALSPEEVIRLKNAGVSDETIQKMIEAEKKGVGGSQGPVTETKDEVIYRAGQNTSQDAQRHAERERMKEEKSLDAVGNVIIDQRRPLPPPRRGGN